MKVSDYITEAMKLDEGIKGADAVAQASQNINQRDRRTWITIYYDVHNNVVMTEDDYRQLADKSGVYKVTDLINPNTAMDVEFAVRRWKCM